MPTVDALDARVLLALTDDPEASVLALSRRLQVARNTVTARLARLTRSGVLAGFDRRVDPAALGYPLTAFVSLWISQTAASGLNHALAQVPEVVEMHSITGGADLMLKVVARDTGHLREVTAGLLSIDGVQRSNTVISLEQELPVRTSGLLRRIAQQPS